MEAGRWMDRKMGHNLQIDRRTERDTDRWTDGWVDNTRNIILSVIYNENNTTLHTWKYNMSLLGYTPSSRIPNNRLVCSDRCSDSRCNPPCTSHWGCSLQSLPFQGVVCKHNKSRNAQWVMRPWCFMTTSGSLMTIWASSCGGTDEYLDLLD